MARRGPAGDSRQVKVAEEENVVAKSTTLIKNASWVVAFDSATGKHKYLRDADVAFAGSKVTFVGKGFSDRPSETVDGTDLMVMPGLLDLHLHAYMEMHGKGFFEDLASKHMGMIKLFEYTWLLQEDKEFDDRRHPGVGLRSAAQRMHDDGGALLFGAPVRRLGRFPGLDRDQDLRLPHDPVRPLVHAGRPQPRIRMV